jgi:hypothetical protein
MTPKEHETFSHSKWCPTPPAESAELAELVISDERRFEANPLSLATIRPAGETSVWV